MSTPAVAVADRDGGLRVSGPDQPLPVFSVTKTFLAVAVLRLVEAGTVDLAGEVHRWLPSAPADLTLAELLTHTAGLPDYATEPAYSAAVDARPGEPWELDRIIEVGLTGERSTRGRFRYSNLGYWLVGAVLERVTTTGLPDLLAELVFAPAGMTASRYPAPGTGVTATGYDTRWAGPAGAAWASARDLVTFLRGPAVADLRAQPTVPVEAHPPWRRPRYGPGIMIDDGLGVAGHGGNGPGYRSAAFTAPGSGRTAAMIMTGTPGTDPTPLVLELLLD